MVNYHFLKKIMVIGERQSLLEMQKYMDIAIENSLILIEIFQRPEDPIEDKALRVSENEKKADNITLELKRNITSGAVGSTLMDNFLNLIETFDDIIDRTYWISREMTRTKDSLIANSFHMEPVGNFYSGFCAILEKNIDAVKKVNQMLQVSDIDGAKSIRTDIEKMEEDVDEIKDGIIDRLYRISESITYLTFNHINSVVHTLDDLLDDCEDIADLILNTMMSVSR
ncbi:MAG: DUF47 family protein [Candidatus Thermoplasmatota archaeon]|jgi:hypothetical protein|nr:DUF47 family protein [Candidatus Thermoplasmatota archaeon]